MKRYLRELLHEALLVRSVCHRGSVMSVAIEIMGGAAAAERAVRWLWSERLLRPTPLKGMVVVLERRERWIIREKGAE